jgi:hypothetical protein
MEHTAKMKLNARLKQGEGASHGPSSPSEESTVSGSNTLSPDPKARLKTLISKHLL